MKIDIHVHTRKVKAGDPDTRNIEPTTFGEIVKSTDVKILAITNHNYFDLRQYEEIRAITSEVCQIWPGIELDILEDGKKAHLLVIANPKHVRQFSAKTDKVLSGKNSDTFNISIKETVDAFDVCDCIYVAHYFVKKPNLDDKAIELLCTLVSNPKRILKEATNSISAGIYISHGHNSIYGSDIQDWNEYVALSRGLPELRLPVESFEQFCLLLEKDEATIETLLSKKVKENIEIAPISAAEIIRLDIYNDINILFGSKGTGKTKILEALSTYFNGKGYKTSVYRSSDLHLDEVFDIRGNRFEIEKANLQFDECEKEIAFLKAVTDEEVTSLSKYYQHFAIQETNKISQRLKIKDIIPLDAKQPNRKFDEVTSISDEFEKFRDYVQETDTLLEYVSPDLLDGLVKAIDAIVSELHTATELKLLDWRSITLLNHIIATFVTEISKKTGQPKKPTKTGFAEYASNRIKIEISAKKILRNINIEIQPMRDYAGGLGEKGSLYCQTNLRFQTGFFTDGEFHPVRNVRKMPQKEFAKQVLLIDKNVFHTDLFKKIAELNEIEEVESINRISDLMLFYRHFTLDGNYYQPSNGESSMILLHRELKEDKEIYLIDEPEKSLGNDYISDVIVPMLKERAQLGKKVIVATHDANIAVRTLPYNSIYRLHDSNRYFTMTGNPFSNTLKCIYNSRPDLDWKEISMKTLEGGRDAFGERGKIYGV